MTDWFGVNVLVDWLGLARLVTRLAFDLGVTTLVIHQVYDRLYRNREYVFTYYLFNMITFLLCSILKQAPVESGVALALFGVFGILRYRTDQIRMRDLTYLFIVIGIGVLNGIADRTVSAAEVVLFNGAIVGLTALLELGRSRHPERSIALLYDRLEMLGAGREVELHADIRARTGLDVLRVEIQEVDLLRDAAQISVVHRPQPPGISAKAPGTQSAGKSG
jgi:hypothetical protein